MSKVLMVAEKPSIAKSISEILSSNKFNVNNNGKIPIYSFNGKFQNKNVEFIVTSVIGHLFSIDFDNKYQNWEKTDPIELFNAEIIQKEASNSINNVIKILEREAKKCNYLVLWLDCDKEGENICFEVIKVTKPFLKIRNNEKYIYRAYYDAITKPDIERAMNHLTDPNINESLGVEARMELDLRIGVAFSRFQTQTFKGKYGDLDSNLISYGPCQTPTLGFCVQRHDIIQTFQPENFYSIKVTISKNNTNINLEWERDRLFDMQIQTLYYNMVCSQKTAKVISVKENVYLI